MNQIDQPSTSNIENSPPPRTSIGIKLPLIIIGLMLFAFLVYTYISIQISQGSRTENIKQDLQAETSDSVKIIQNTLKEAQTIAINLATAVETGQYDESSLDLLLQSTLTQHEQIFASAIAYEPYQFNPGLYYWSPYYSRTNNNQIKFTQLGNPEYDYLNQEWYLSPKQNLVATLSSPYYHDGGGEIWMITASAPFFDKSKNFKGVATADIEFSKIQHVFTDLQIGKRGYAFLIDSHGTILGIGNEGGDFEVMSDSMIEAGTSRIAVNWSELIDDMIRGRAGLREATDVNNLALYVAYAPIGLNTGWSLGIAYPKEEILAQNTALQFSLVTVSFILAIIFGIIIYFFTRSITTPLRQLTLAASQIASEKPENIKEQLSSSIQIQTQDELEDLANAFTQMALNLKQSLEGLEEKVSERTLDLETSRIQSERRANDLQAISEISKVIAGEQKLPNLLPLITRLVSERFGFYHTGIFMLDENNRYAILQAASSDGGKNMLARGHKLEVGESGIVGYVAKLGTPRIALDVGLDAVYFDNPDLPNTRSEMALPLIVRNKIVGVLDLQSTKPGAFTESELYTMSILADQVAIAIENVRLFQQTQVALAEAEALYRQNTQTGWQEFSREENSIGYHQTLTSGSKLFTPLDTDEIRQVMNQGKSIISNTSQGVQEASIVVPIILRGQVIGALKVKAPEQDRAWSKDEINLTEVISERLSLALENSRLLQESQNKAATEQIISDIATKLGASVRTENILRTTALELSQLLNNADIFIDINPKTINLENKDIS